jgi:hypothetical protein
VLALGTDGSLWAGTLGGLAWRDKAIVRQAALGAGRAVALPAAVLVASRQAGGGASPD